jgi:Arc/MetJ-type ribon-helix-helix transcriptional regulator
MAKETVRYPDALVARIEAFVGDSAAFESKSEYHRFASEFLLSLLDPEHEPSVLGYGEIFEDLEGELGEVLGGQEDEGEERFLRTYIEVRRHLLHGEHEEARAVVDATYDVTDREALLLDEFVGQSPGVGAPPSTRGDSGGHVVGPDPPDALESAGRSESSDPRTTNGRSRHTESSDASETANRADGATGDHDDSDVEETPIESEH